MQLLIEQLLPSETKMITESAPDGKRMWIKGICMQSTIKNRNGRTYPLTEIQTAVSNASQRIAEYNGIFGELDHPQTLTVNSDRISHVIREMWISGNDAYSKAELLDTPTGRIAQELYKTGVKIGVSSRGAGNVNESGDVSGFQFITYDIVITPSAPGAYQSAIYEHLEDSKQGRLVMTLAEQLRADPTAQKYFRDEIIKFATNTLKVHK